MNRLTLALLCLVSAAALAPAPAAARPRWDSIPWWGDLDAAERGRVERLADEQHAYGACTDTIAACFDKGKRIGWRLARLVIYLVQRGASDEDIGRILGERKASAEAPVRTIDTAGTPAYGPAGAPVTVVEFADFECPFCAVARPILEGFVKKRFGDRLIFWGGIGTQTTMPFGNFEQPFNLPFLADACGAVYVARWTVFHVRQLAKAMKEGLQKKGFVFIEALSPCPTLYSRRNRLGDGVDQLKYFKEKSTIKNGADTKDVGLSYQGDITVGKFVDRERATWLDAMNAHFSKVLGERFTPYGGSHGQD